MGDIFFGVEGADSEVQKGLQKLLSTKKAQELWGEFGEDIVGEGDQEPEDEESEDLDDLMCVFIFTGDHLILLGIFKGLTIL